MTSERKFIFICGAARSGTTALAKLLNQHPSVAIGIERYKTLPTRDLVPDVFTRERFFDFRPGDTNIRVPKQYARLAKKFDNVCWTGDKVPRYYTKYRRILRNFPDCKIGFILRDIESMASSWNARADDTTDSWRAVNDYRRAVDEWNTSIALTLQFLKGHPERLFVVKYEQLFCGDEQVLRALFGELDLALTEKTNRYFRKVTAGWSERVARDLVMKPGQAEFIAANADWSSYHAILEHALPRGGASESGRS